MITSKPSRLSVWMGIILFFFLTFGCIPSSSAQNMVELLLGQGTVTPKVELKTPNLLLMEEASSRIKNMSTSLEHLRKRIKERTPAWDKDTAKCRDLITTYQIKIGFSDWRDAPQLTKLRIEVVSVAEQCLAVITQLQSAYASREQNLLSLRDALQNFLKTKQNFPTFIKKYYLENKDITRLEQDMFRVKGKLKEHRKLFEDSRTEAQKLGESLEKNKQALELARKQLLYSSSLHKKSALSPTQLGSSPSPPTQPKKTTPRKRAKKKPAPRTTSRPTSQHPITTTVGSLKGDAIPSVPKLPTAEELRQAQIRRYALKLSEDTYRQRFHTLRTQSLLLRIRIRDEATEQEISVWQIRMYEYLQHEMKLAYKDLLSHSRIGLWYRHQLSLRKKMWVDTATHTGRVLRNTPQALALVTHRLSQNWKSLDQVPTILALLFAIFLIVVLFILTRTTRSRLEHSMKTLSEKAEMASVTRMFWLSLQLIFRSVYDLLPYFGGLLVVGGLFWILELPYAWQIMLWNVGLVLLGFRAIGTLSILLFGPQREYRFFRSLNDVAAQRFRRIIQMFRIVALFYLPSMQAVQLLGYSEPFVHLLKIIFYGFLVFCLSLLLLNQEDLLNLLPANTQVARTVLVVVYRLYPTFFVLTVGLFAIYVWGYVNFVSYLVRGLLLTSIIAGLAYALYRLFWIAGLVIFGLSKESTALIRIEKRTARNFLRLGRFVLGIFLIGFGFSLLMEVWGIAEGFATLARLIQTPFLQIKDTQLTIISLGKFALSLLMVLFLSRWVRDNATKYVYPALELSIPNQHATNTVLGYSILIMGLLFGLQWMGLGIGVLTVFAGVIGIGVGFGLQNIASNFISGLIITFGKPIKVGDIIEVGNLTGQVKEISARSTTIETQDLRIVLIPNAEILTTKVINWSMGHPFIMVYMIVGVAYGSNVPAVMKTLMQVALSHPKVLKEHKPYLRFDNFGSSSLDFSLWVAIANPLERFDILSDIRIEVDRLFRERNITIAFPQQDIHFDKELQQAMLESLKSPQHTTTPPKGDNTSHG